MQVDVAAQRSQQLQLRRCQRGQAEHGQPCRQAGKAAGFRRDQSGQCLRPHAGAMRHRAVPHQSPPQCGLPGFVRLLRQRAGAGLPGQDPVRAVQEVFLVAPGESLRQFPGRAGLAQQGLQGLGPTHGIRPVAAARQLALDPQREPFAFPRRLRALVSGDPRRELPQQPPGKHQLQRRGDAPMARQFPLEPAAHARVRNHDPFARERVRHGRRREVARQPRGQSLEALVVAIRQEDGIGRAVHAVR